MIGPNGAGKMTVFGMIAGQEQPDDGHGRQIPASLLATSARISARCRGVSVVAAVMDGVGPFSALAREVAQLEAAMADPEQADKMDALDERYGEMRAREGLAT